MGRLLHGSPSIQLANYLVEGRGPGRRCVTTHTHARWDGTGWDGMTNNKRPPRGVKGTPLLRESTRLLLAAEVVMAEEQSR